MSQTAELLRLLRARGEMGVTPLDALTQLGTFRLAARIYDLRRDGHDIWDMGQRTPSGKHVARYVLNEPEQLRWTR